MGGQVNVAELCRVHGVSRETGHLWIRRLRDAAGLQHLSLDRL